jgi:hypothetical protein
MGAWECVYRACITWNDIDEKGIILFLIDKMCVYHPRSTGIARALWIILNAAVDFKNQTRPKIFIAMLSLITIGN